MLYFYFDECRCVFIHTALLSERINRTFMFYFYFDEYRCVFIHTALLSERTKRTFMFYFYLSTFYSSYHKHLFYDKIKQITGGGHE